VQNRPIFAIKKNSMFGKERFGWHIAMFYVCAKNCRNGDDHRKILPNSEVRAKYAMKILNMLLCFWLPLPWTTYRGDFSYIMVRFWLLKI
jgi:hypothetical protein